MGRAILSGGACFTNNVLQNVVRNMRRTQTRSNDVEQLFVSNRGKLENWFSDSVSLVIHVADLRTEFNGWNNVYTFGVLFKKISRNFVAQTSQSGAKRRPISRYSGDLD